MKNKIRILTALMAVMLCMAAFPMTAHAGGGPEEEETAAPVEETTEPETAEPQALTPEGNLTLVDDIDGEASGDKQFITVITKGGNYFYIIIDRAEDGENTVHFLNLVDEADLMALVEDGQIETQGTAVTPQVETEPEETAEPEPEQAAEASSGMGGILVFVLVLALAGGGAFYYFRVMKPKQSTKGGTGLDDFDFEDDEDEETETEVFEEEQEDTGE